MATKNQKEKNTKAENSVSTVRRARHGTPLTIFFTILSILWIYPIIVVVLNSFKRKAYIFRNPFGLSSVPLSDGFDKWQAGLSKAFVAWLN